LGQTPLGLDTYVPAPDDNPTTPEKVALGRKLFHDPRLSRDGTISCATCHDPARGFADDKPLAVGIGKRRGVRRTPTIVNRGYGESFFWDGRARTLEEQVLQPVSNPVEMDLPREQIEKRTGLAPDVVARALASYLRTVLAGDSPFDRYMAGDRSALSDEARRGLAVFRGKANCVACHVGPNLTDERFHNTGVGWNGEAFDDTGRYEATKREEHRGSFKTPTLREASKRPPYMHDGSLATLEEVIRFYDDGGRPNPSLDQEIRPLQLTAEEKRDLLAFLHALSGAIRH
jgi:cytochrome c peroxidase